MYVVRTCTSINGCLVRRVDMIKVIEWAFNGTLLGYLSVCVYTREKKKLAVRWRTGVVSIPAHPETHVYVNVPIFSWNDGAL